MISVLLLSSPAILLACLCFGLDKISLVPVIGFPLIPLLPAVIGIVFHVAYGRNYGTVIFDREARSISLAGHLYGAGRQLPMNAVKAVQFCDVGWQSDSEGMWRTFQVNLVMEGAEVDRVSLLECAARRPLYSIAQQISDVLEVPLYRGSKRV